jgi:xanthine dehydrogenase iron-sulfur cluster and FAD-binding subunit A
MTFFTVSDRTKTIELILNGKKQMSRQLDITTLARYLRKYGRIQGQFRCGCYVRRFVR